MYPRETKKYVKMHQPVKRKIVTTTLQAVKNITTRISARKKTQATINCLGSLFR